MDLRWVVYENRPINILKDYYWDETIFFLKGHVRLNKAFLFWRGPKSQVLENFSNALNKVIFLRMFIKTQEDSYYF